MHFYERHIGDYYKKAGRLTILQHGVYTLLIDAIYDRERFPTRAEAAEWTWVSTSDENQALDFLLSRFFTQNGAGQYEQKHIAEDLERYRAFCLKQLANGKKGGRPKNPNESGGLPVGSQWVPKDNPLGSEINPVETQNNPKPLPTTQLPLPTAQHPDKTPTPDGVLPLADIPKEKPAKRTKQETHLAHYLETRKQSGKKPFDDGSAVVRYTKLTGLPDEYLALAWRAFREDHTDGGSREHITYTRTGQLYS